MLGGAKRKLQEVHVNTPTKRGKRENGKPLGIAVAKRAAAAPDTPPSEARPGGARFSVYGCRAHEGGRSGKLSRTDIEKNKARVDEKTIYGQKRRRGELAQEEHDGRCGVADEEVLDRGEIKRRKVDDAAAAVVRWEQRVRDGVVWSEECFSALLHDMMGNRFANVRSEADARRRLRLQLADHAVADALMTEDALRAAISNGEAAAAVRLFDTLLPFHTALARLAEAEARARRGVASEQVYCFGELEADNDVGRTLVLGAQESAGRAEIVEVEAAVSAALWVEHYSCVVGMGEAEARCQVELDCRTAAGQHWAAHCASSLCCVEAEAMRTMAADAAAEAFARAGCSAVHEMVLAEAAGRGVVEAGWSSGCVEAVTAGAGSVRAAVEKEEAAGAAGLAAEVGLCRVVHDEAVRRVCLVSECDAEARQGVVSMETSGRDAVTREEAAAANGLDAAHNALFDEMLLLKLVACEAEMRELYEGEEASAWDELAGEAAEEQRALFGVVDDFLSAQDFFNTRQRLHALNPWVVCDAARVPCALNPHLASLLTAANALLSTYETKHAHAAEQHEIELGQLRAALNAYKGDVSKLSTELKETQTRLAFEISQHAKLKASFDLTKRKVEHLDRQARSTAGANEKAKLEKQLRDMQLKLNATENALEKERARKRK